MSDHSSLPQPRATRLLLAAAALLTLLLAGVWGTQAWFFHQRSLQTLAAIHAPLSLNLGAGNQDPIACLELGNIDVSKSGQQDYVFCVYGTSDAYLLQLAHTTNIPFSYTLYAAQPADGEADAAYTDTAGVTYYYQKVSANSSGGEPAPLAGSWLNGADGGTASGAYHSATYGSYDRVQANAEPLYWQSDTITPVISSRSGQFCDYYILTISWGSELSNNKETDLVYLTAGLAAAADPDADEPATAGQSAAE